jgi:hypothetical protein
MLIDTSERAVTPSAAHLLIHADGKLVNGYRLTTTLRRLCAAHLCDYKFKREPLRLQIVDLQGKLMLAIDDASALVDVSLPAGTYQVIAHFGKVQRDYTLTLTQGASFDLYLRLTLEKP